MSKSYFKTLETAATGSAENLAIFVNQLQYNQDGLIPAIAQQHDSGEVLMMAWMNKDSILETLSTGQVCYWSRSRQAYWRKGESSGNVQKLVEMRTDCDGDTLLLQVNQTGAACHTERDNCFFWQFDGKNNQVKLKP